MIILININLVLMYNTFHNLISSFVKCYFNILIICNDIFRAVVPFSASSLMSAKQADITARLAINACEFLSNIPTERWLV